MRLWQVVPVLIIVTLQRVSAKPLEDTSPNDRGLKSVNDSGDRAVCEIPQCGETAGSSDARTIGYLQSSSYKETRCKDIAGSILSVGLTHINYAFGVVGEDYRIAATNSFDVDCYVQLHEFKRRIEGLKLFISLRVLAAEGKLWHNMIQTAEGRTTFVGSVVRFMDTFAFDGIDLYFEDSDIEKLKAHSEDIRGTITLIKELQAALRATGQISMAFPASLDYLHHSQAINFAPYVDWFNLMNPGFHWNQALGPDKQSVKLLPHSNLTEMASVLDRMAQSGIQPHQLVMGMAFYGRAFEIQDTQCTEMMCPAKKIASTEPGERLRLTGIWSQAQIQEKLNETGALPKLARDVGVKYALWDDRWVSFDDDETWENKKRFANSRCILGTAIWALDLEFRDDRHSSLLTIARKHSYFLNQPERAGRHYFQRNVGHHIRRQNNAPTSILLTDCTEYPECPAGYYEIGSAHGTWSQFDIFAQGCDILPRRRRLAQRRAMCLPDNIATHGCSWVGQPPFCGAGCPKGTVEMALNNGPSGSFPAQLCHPYYWSAFCCERVVLTDQPQHCDDFDLGSLLVQGLGPTAVSAAGAASREAVRMTQIFGSNRQEELLHDGFMETFDVCKRIFERKVRQGQGSVSGE